MEWLFREYRFRGYDTFLGPPNGGGKEGLLHSAIKC